MGKDGESLREQVQPAAAGNGEELDHRGVMARSLMWLFVAGATLSLFSLVTPQETAVDKQALVRVAVSGYAMAMVLLLAERKLPAWTFQVFLAAATMMVEWLVWASADDTSPYVAFYFWVAIYAFYFFTRRQAIMQTLFIILAYAAVLGFVEDPTAKPVVRWVITTSALVFAGAMIGILQDRVASLDRSVRRDAVTDLLNGRGFNEALEIELERARRSGETLSVVIAKLDGPQGGSQSARRSETDTLKGIARLLGTVLRAGDQAAHIEAHEFAILAPNTDDHGAYLLAERLRGEVRRAFTGRADRITLSFGVASFPTHGATAAAVVHAASQGVAAAEQLGRDRTVIYSAEIAGLVLAAESRRWEERGGGNLAAVLALTEVLDIRDAGTAVHSQTVGRYAEAIARELGLSPELVERVRLAGTLHDVGKIAVPDAVLSKPAKLTDDEFDQMKKHPEVGAVIIDGAELKDISSRVWAHHERPAGRGYPRGRSDEEIPLEAKILAVADSYEAMTCDRVYRKAMPAEDARAELRRCSGTQFDRRIVQVFVEMLEREDPNAGPTLEPVDAWTA
ncbi:MAG: hypothetical protein QOE08_1168 [Thermoleophilaceae bacterium]|nr:hypothetical protein [Thermoleophilaceae bacterium]